MAQYLLTLEERCCSSSINSRIGVISFEVWVEAENLMIDALEID